MAIGMDGRNGDMSDTSSDEGTGNKIKVGKDYQAVTPEFIPPSEQEATMSNMSDLSLLVWKPSDEISDAAYDEYLQLAKEKYKYNAEQALGMLFWHKYDMQRAYSDLSNFQPFPDDWTSHDKMIFEQCFLYSGKNFDKIRLSLPEKSIRALIKYYYSWKKTKSRISLMDYQVKKINNNNNNNNNNNGANYKDDGTIVISDAASDPGSITDSDTEDKVKEDKDRGSNKCSNCSILCTYLHSTPKGIMCRTCMLHYKKTGSLRPTVSLLRNRSGHRSSSKNKCNLPRGMYINHDDLLTIASMEESRGNVILRVMDMEMATLKRNVQDSKQKISLLKHQVPESIDSYREPDLNVSRISARWTNDELLLAVEGVRKFGKNFKSIAEVIGTKTEAHIKSFFMHHKQRYNLDEVLREYQIENGVIDDVESNDSTESSAKEEKTITMSESNTDIVPCTSSSSSITAP